MFNDIRMRIMERLRAGATKGLRSPLMEGEEMDDTQINPKQQVPKKDVYECFVFMLYFFDLPALRERVIEHERLHLLAETDFIDMYDEAFMDKVRKADILLMSSGGGAFDIDAFLKEVDIRQKTVVIVSSYGPEKYGQWIKSRIDYHIPKHLIVRPEDFRDAMKPILQSLDG